jgi:hypothetical protein
MCGMLAFVEAQDQSIHGMAAMLFVDDSRRVRTS